MIKQRAESREQRAESGPSPATRRAEMWRVRREVIGWVREVPLWDEDAMDSADMRLLGTTFNELRQKALHLASMVERDMESHAAAIERSRRVHGPRVFRGKEGARV